MVRVSNNVLRAGQDETWVQSTPPTKPKQTQLALAKRPSVQWQPQILLYLAPIGA